MAVNADAIQALADVAGADGDLSAIVSTVCGELIWFAAGVVVNLLVWWLSRLHWQRTARGQGGAVATGRRRSSAKTLGADVAAGHLGAALDTWRQGRTQAEVLPLDALQAAAQALAGAAPERLAPELTSYLERHAKALPQPATTNALLDAILQSGRAGLAEELVESLQQRLRFVPDARTNELLLAGLAAEGDEQRVAELSKRLDVSHEGPSPRGQAMVVRGFLRSGRLDAAARQLLEMKRQGLAVPPRIVAEVVRAAAEAGAGQLGCLLDRLGGHMPLPSEAVASALSKCVQWEDVELARRVERLAREQRTPLLHAAYEALLKLHARVPGPRALELFAEMRREGFSATEGLCGSLLARSAEPQNLEFAEAVAGYLREQKMMTLATYKTLMKVYACCGCYEQACDLYSQVCADGIEPDHVMYGCLVKFAVKCGRSALSQELFEKARGGDIQNYMWLIRAAGQEGDVDRALELLQGLKSTNEGSLDIAVYNCALDACVRNAALNRAHTLLQEIEAAGMANLITYNTLMKGYCAQGDLARARRTISDMEARGLSPDSASYNCVLSAAVSSGCLREAWAVVEEMERRGVKRDQYTISIMMKLARKEKDPRQGRRALRVLDQAGLHICEDEVCFNTVLDACIHLRDEQRLEWVLKSFGASKMKPSVQSYGLLIKAFSMMKRPSKCWEQWKDMTQHRGLTPNDVTLSCMLDALASSGGTEDAVALFREWKPVVPPNTVIYSTLIKGFVNAGDSARAMEMYHELRAEGLQMNMVAYTTVIDSQARDGRMEEAEALLQQMEQDGCQPNTITYSILIKGHCIKGDMEAALRLFHEMLRRGLKADTVVFNTMLDGCVRHSHFELADQLLAEMKKYPVEPSNFTLSIVVKMWGKRRRLPEAFEAVSQCLREGRVRLDASVGACLVGACVQNRDAEKALEAFAQIKQWPGCGGPDARTYGALIGGLSRCGHCREAVPIAEEACKLAVVRSPAIAGLSQEPLRLLLRTLRQRGLASELGQPLAEKLRAAGLLQGHDGDSSPAREEAAQRRPQCGASVTQRGGGRGCRC